MKSWFRSASAALGLVFLFPGCSRAASPKPFASAPCQSPPTIDGVDRALTNGVMLRSRPLSSA